MLIILFLQENVKCITGRFFNNELSLLRENANDSERIR